MLKGEQVHLFDIHEPLFGLAVLTKLKIGMKTQDINRHFLEAMRRNFQSRNTAARKAEVALNLVRGRAKPR